MRFHLDHEVERRQQSKTCQAQARSAPDELILTLEEMKAK